MEILSAQGLSQVPKNLVKRDLPNNNTTEQNVQSTSSTYLSTTEIGTTERYDGDRVIVNAGSIMCAGVFIIIVISYSFITIRKSRRANMVSIKRYNSANPIQLRPLPQPPLENDGYEVPIEAGNDRNSTVSTHNLQLVRDDSLSRTVLARDHVLTENNHGSMRSLSCSMEYQDNLPYSSDTYIYSCSEVHSEEENYLPVRPMEDSSSFPSTTQFRRAKQPSSTAVPPRPLQTLGSHEDDGHLQKQITSSPPVSIRPTYTFEVPPITNGTTFVAKKTDSGKLYVSSTFIKVGRDS